MIQKLKKEPLVHFFILGLILYIYYTQTQVQTNVQTKSVIDISKYEIKQIKSNYKNEWAKEITKAELQALITQKYYNKVLLDEAYLLNLHKQDEVISKRLLKKMHFVMLNSAKIIEPSEKQLYDYYKKNIIDYSAIKTLSFVHIFYPPNTDKKKIDEIFKLLKQVPMDVDKAVDFSEKFKKQNILKNISLKETKKLFGSYFADKLFKLKMGVWHKPMHSKFGTHIVYIKEKNVTTPYPFDDVQGRVYEDFMEEFKTNIEKKAYKRVLSSYKLKVE